MIVYEEPHLARRIIRWPVHATVKLACVIWVYLLDRESAFWAKLPPHPAELHWKRRVEEHTKVKT